MPENQTGLSESKSERYRSDAVGLSCNNRLKQGIVGAKAKANFRQRPLLTPDEIMIPLDGNCTIFARYVDVSWRGLPCLPVVRAEQGSRARCYTIHLPMAPTIFRSKILKTKPAPFMEQGRADVKKQRLPRLRRASRHRLPGFSLTQRDIAIVQAVWDYRALTAEHIETLFFPQSVEQGRRQTNSNCQTRLRQLYHRGLLQRKEYPMAIGEPRKPLVYWLDRAGAELIATTRGIEFSGVGWRPGSYKVGLQFLAHLLDTNTVRVHVVRSAKAHGFGLAEWRDEAMLRTAHAADRVTIVTPQGTRQEAIVIPDGYFVLNIPVAGGEALRYQCFLEIDRRTVTGQATDWRHGQHDWVKKIMTYLSYIRSGKFEARYGTLRGRILTMTTGERRLANLKAITEESGGKARFWFTTLERIKAGDILTDPIWSVATRNTVHQLVE